MSTNIQLKSEKEMSNKTDTFVIQVPHPVICDMVQKVAEENGWNSTTTTPFSKLGATTLIFKPSNKSIAYATRLDYMKQYQVSLEEGLTRIVSPEKTWKIACHDAYVDEHGLHVGCTTVPIETIGEIVSELERQGVEI